MTNQTIEKWLEKAIKARESAYALYSSFKVGAVVWADNGFEWGGCNVENQSYGLTICAEANAITTAVSGGMKKIKLIGVVADQDHPVSPCGACRQIIGEFSDSKTIIIMGNLKKEYKVISLEELLPYQFKL